LWLKSPSEAKNKSYCVVTSLGYFATNQNQIIMQDLFEFPGRWSKQLLELMNAATESPTYQELEQLQKECRAIGYTFEFGLDAVPFNLKKIEG